MLFLIEQILKKFTVDVHKDVAVGQAVTLSAKSADLNLLLNNQDKLTISPELTRKGSFVVVISKEKIDGAGGNTDQNSLSLYHANTFSSKLVMRILRKSLIRRYCFDYH